MFANIRTSLRLTSASFHLIFRKPVVLALPLITLAWCYVWSGGLTWALMEWAKASPSTFQNFWQGVFFMGFGPLESGNFVAAMWGFIITGYVLYAIWLTIVGTGFLYTVTVGMDVATQQIRTGDARLGPSFKLAARNLGRLFLLALVMATLLSWVKYLIRFGLGFIPVLGWWLRRVVELVLTAVTYLMLPIVVYERAGPLSAMKSAWRSVRKTWSGLVLGSTILYVGTYLLFTLVMGGLMQAALLPVQIQVVVNIFVGAIIFAFASTIAAAMRATLYWYATTGEVPAGFNVEDLPKVQSHGAFTRAPVAGLYPRATTATAGQPRTAAPNRAPAPRAAPKTPGPVARNAPPTRNAPASRAPAKKPPAKR